jgi:hypothetical protein
MRLPVLLFSALLATSAAVHAQERRFDCSQAKDPKACEERVAKMKATRTQAEKACEGQQGAARRECMLKNVCAQQKDPAKCEAFDKERMARREKIREACKDKRGEELKACIREHRSQK